MGPWLMPFWIILSIYLKLTEVDAVVSHLDPSFGTETLTLQLLWVSLKKTVLSKIIPGDGPHLKTTPAHVWSVWEDPASGLMGAHSEGPSQLLSSGISWDFCCTNTDCIVLIASLSYLAFFTSQVSIQRTPPNKPPALKSPSQDGHTVSFLRHQLGWFGVTLFHCFLFPWLERTPVWKRQTEYAAQLSPKADSTWQQIWKWWWLGLLPTGALA